MEELIATFHIDWKLMIAQIVNFVIVFYVVWRFALKPLMKTMGERSLTIEKSLKDAEEIERKLKQTDDDARQHISEARAQALAILNETKKHAEVKKQEMLADAKKEVDGLIASAREQIQGEKESMLTQARQELSCLVSLGVQKILGKTMTKRINEKFVKAQIKDLK